MPVNPYVTGSSPVARATIYRRFLRFFFTFTTAIRSGIKGQKMPKMTPKLYIFYTNLYYDYTRILGLFRQQALHQCQQGFQKIRNTPTHGQLVRVSLVKNSCFYTKINRLYLKMLKMLVRVSLVQKSPDFYDFCF